MPAAPFIFGPSLSSSQPYTVITTKKKTHEEVVGLTTTPFVGEIVLSGLGGGRGGGGVNCAAWISSLDNPAPSSCILLEGAIKLRVRLR